MAGGGDDSAEPGVDALVEDEAHLSGRHLPPDESDVVPSKARERVEDLGLLVALAQVLAYGVHWNSRSGELRFAPVSAATPLDGADLLLRSAGGRLFADLRADLVEVK